MVGSGELKMVSINSLFISSVNVRRNTSDLTELIDSIESTGRILQPLLVRPEGQKYGIICGSRRFHAAKALGLSELPCNIQEMNDEEAIQASLIENIHRDNLSFKEELEAYKLLKRIYLREGYPKENINSFIAQQLGVSQQRIIDTFAAEKAMKMFQKGNKRKLIVEKYPKTSKTTVIKRKSNNEDPKDISISKASAADLQRTFESIKKYIPKEQRNESFILLAEEVSKMPREDARRLFNRLKVDLEENPKKPIREIVEQAKAKSNGVFLKIYLPPRIMKRLENAAKERSLDPIELIPKALDEWLKQVGH